MSALAIARVELVRLLRDRSNIFFVFVFPLLLVVLIGASFGSGFAQQVGVAGAADGAGQRLVERIDAAEGIETVDVDDVDELADRVSDGGLSAGVVVPDDLDARLDDGQAATVELITTPGTGGQGVGALVTSAVGEQAVVAKATGALTGAGAAPDEARRTVEELDERLPPLAIEATAVGEDELAREFAGLGTFDLGASSQLFLFTFLTALAASASLVQARRLGVVSRALATPTTMGTLIVGQAGGRVLIAALQAAYIIAATALAFGVDWGDPLATGAVVAAFCLLSGGAAMLVGAIAGNDSQASGLGVGLGLLTAALGGSMAPLEIFPPTMQQLARITPHAWANEAMAEIVRRDATLVDVLPQVGVLTGYAVVLLIAASLVLRRAIATGR